MTTVQPKVVYQMSEFGVAEPLLEDDPAITNRLFVYGIFLGETMRNSYGMTNPVYATVPGYFTVGHHIVQAVPIPERPDIALTGLTVDVDPEYWERLDRLEGGYDRVVVKTTDEEKVFMYASPERGI